MFPMRTQEPSLSNGRHLESYLPVEIGAGRRFDVQHLGTKALISADVVIGPVQPAMAVADHVAIPLDVEAACFLFIVGAVPGDRDLRSVGKGTRVQMRMRRYWKRFDHIQRTARTQPCSPCSPKFLLMVPSSPRCVQNDQDLKQHKYHERPPDRLPESL